MYYFTGAEDRNRVTAALACPVSLAMTKFFVASARITLAVRSYRARSSTVRFLIPSCRSTFLVPKTGIEPVQGNPIGF
jgi:hypothetical protein